jgi:hypothetical protein
LLTELFKPDPRKCSFVYPFIHKRINNTPTWPGPRGVSGFAVSRSPTAGPERQTNHFLGSVTPCTSFNPT